MSSPALDIFRKKVPEEIGGNTFLKKVPEERTRSIKVLLVASVSAVAIAGLVAPAPVQIKALPETHSCPYPDPGRERHAANYQMGEPVSGGDFRFVRTQGRPWQLPRPVKSYAFPDQARTYFQNASFLSDLEAVFEEQVDAIFYLGPLREYPNRDYLWARSRPLCW